MKGGVVGLAGRAVAAAWVGIIPNGVVVDMGAIVQAALSFPARDRERKQASMDQIAA